MKKFLSVILSAFCLAIVINFADESKVHAERIWAFSVGNVNYYVDIDRSYWFAAVVLNDDRSGYVHPVEFQFVNNLSGSLACNINYDNGTRDFVMLYESRMAQAVFNVMRNHPKFKNDIESALYNLQHPEEAAEKRRRQAEQAKREQQAKKAREEQEVINKFNALIAEADKFYAEKEYFGACGDYEAAGKIKLAYHEKINDGKSHDGLTYYEKDTVVFSGSDKIKEFFDNLVKNGDDLYAQKNYSAALDYYRKAIVMKP